MDHQARIGASRNQEEPLPTEDAFFDALLAGDVESLEGLLSDDFVIVDVRKGAEVDRSGLLEAIASRQVAFTALSVVERRVRHYGEVAVVVGRTSMRGQVGAAKPWAWASARISANGFRSRAMRVRM